MAIRNLSVLHNPSLAALYCAAAPRQQQPELQEASTDINNGVDGVLQELMMAMSIGPALGTLPCLKSCCCPVLVINASPAITWSVQSNQDNQPLVSYQACPRDTRRSLFDIVTTDDTQGQV